MSQQNSPTPNVAAEAPFATDFNDDNATRASSPEEKNRSTPNSERSDMKNDQSRQSSVAKEFDLPDETKLPTGGRGSAFTTSEDNPLVPEDASYREQKSKQTSLAHSPIESRHSEENTENDVNSMIEDEKNELSDLDNFKEKSDDNLMDDKSENSDENEESKKETMENVLERNSSRNSLKSSTNSHHENDSINDKSESDDNNEKSDKDSISSHVNQTYDKETSEEKLLMNNNDKLSDKFDGNDSIDGNDRPTSNDPDNDSVDESNNKRDNLDDDKDSLSNRSIKEDLSSRSISPQLENLNKNIIDVDEMIQEKKSPESSVPSESPVPSSTKLTSSSTTAKPQELPIISKSPIAQSPIDNNSKSLTKSPLDSSIPKPATPEELSSESEHLTVREKKKSKIYIPIDQKPLHSLKKKKESVKKPAKVKEESKKDDPSKLNKLKNWFGGNDSEEEQKKIDVSSQRLHKNGNSNNLRGMRKPSVLPAIRKEEKFLKSHKNETLPKRTAKTPPSLKDNIGKLLVDPQKNKKGDDISKTDKLPPRKMMATPKLKKSKTSSIGGVEIMNNLQQKSLTKPSSNDNVKSTETPLKKPETSSRLSEKKPLKKSKPSTPLPINKDDGLKTPTSTQLNSTINTTRQSIISKTPQLSSYPITPISNKPEKFEEPLRTSENKKKMEIEPSLKVNDEGKSEIKKPEKRSISASSPSRIPKLTDKRAGIVYNKNRNNKHHGYKTFQYFKDRIAIEKDLPKLHLRDFQTPEQKRQQEVNRLMSQSHSGRLFDTVNRRQWNTGRGYISDSCDSRAKTMTISRDPSVENLHKSKIPVSKRPPTPLRRRQIHRSVENMWENKQRGQPQILSPLAKRINNQLATLSGGEEARIYRRPWNDLNRSMNYQSSRHPNMVGVYDSSETEGEDLLLKNRSRTKRHSSTHSLNLNHPVQLRGRDSRNLLSSEFWKESANETFYRCEDAFITKLKRTSNLTKSFIIIASSIILIYAATNIFQDLFSWMV
ncbi:hypothetical protein SNEBB_010526 [Seison nebaliae]|nr:hypothetical protein SNEBB_010526 [Seison nebaliae]